MLVFLSTQSAVLFCLGFIAPAIIAAIYPFIPRTSPIVREANQRKEREDAVGFYFTLGLSVAIPVGLRAFFPDINLWGAVNEWWALLHIIGWLYISAVIPVLVPFGIAVMFWWRRRIQRQLIWLLWALVTIGYCYSISYNFPPSA